MSGLQFPLFAKPGKWRPPAMGDLPDWNRAIRIGFDLECRDPNLRKKFPGTTTTMGPGYFRRDGEICGIGFALEYEPDNIASYYLPIRHQGGGNMDPDAVLRYVREQAARYTGMVVGANLSYDLQWSATEDIHFQNASAWRDVCVNQPLIYELDREFSLAAICNRLGVQGKDETELINRCREFGVAGKDDKDVKGNIWRLPGQHVGEYGEADAVAPLRALRAQEPLFDQLDLHRIVNLESALVPILAQYQRRGLRVNEYKLERVCDWAQKQEREALAKIKHLTGVEIPFGKVWSKSCLVPMFEAVGVRLNPQRMKKNGDVEYQINAAVFAANQNGHPAVELLDWARSANTIWAKFGRRLRNFTINGRVHPQLKQICTQDADQGESEAEGTRFGRMSCKNPPMQQEPSRDCYAPMWKDVYEPEEGAIMGNSDYSQQEPRAATAIAAMVRLKNGGCLGGAAEAVQAYINDPTIDHHTFMAKESGIERKRAKSLFLGMCYGQGERKTCEVLGLPIAYLVRCALRGVESKTFEGEGAHQQALQAASEMRKLYGKSWVRAIAGREGKAIIEKFNQRVPYVKQLAEVAADRAERYGYLRTLGGRRLNFPRDEKTGEFYELHKALNKVIQGTCADQMKHAIVQCDKELPNAFISLQVHDALLGSYASVAEAKKVAGVMSSITLGMATPFRVDTEVGESYGSLKAT